MTKKFIGLSVFFVGFVLFSCNNIQSDTIHSEMPNTKGDDTQSFVVEAESYTNAEGEMKIEENDGEKYVVTPEGDSWMTFEIKVPKAGRYICELKIQPLSNGISAWVEDYIDNKDGRTYNITGSIQLPDSKQTFIKLTKDGSPLNKGIHNIKLHLEGGSAKVDWIKFALFKEHQLTPQIMTQKTDGKEWKVVWSDEFEGEGLPDTSKWTYDVGNWGWGNNELQYYTENRLENARQENGNLIIEAKKNDMGQEWTSARLTTRGKVTFLFGRIEFKAKVPPNRGNWAAGWTLGDDYVDELSWPYCGEIDILESVGYEMNDETGDGKAHASAHCGAYYFKLGNQPTGILDVKNMDNDYHIYAVDWTPDGIIASVDGNEYFIYNDNTSELAWPFDKAQNIILNLAMGGGWGGLQGMDESVTSQKYLIDYVRVYEKQ